MPSGVLLWATAVLSSQLHPLAADLIRNQSRLQDPVRAVLLKADRIELFSLNPFTKPGGDKATLRGWPVLGSVTVTDKDTRAKLVREVEAGIAATKVHDIALCFHPRHAVRATADGVTAELVICFECWRVEVYHGGKGLRDEATTAAPQKYLDELLTAAKVPLAPKKRDDR
jgi:hypothetical protein